MLCFWCDSNVRDDSMLLALACGQASCIEMSELLVSCVPDRAPYTDIQVAQIPMGPALSSLLHEAIGEPLDGHGQGLMRGEAVPPQPEVRLQHTAQESAAQQFDLEPVTSCTKASLRTFQHACQLQQGHGVC